jgi:hypothetical protein
MFQNCARYVAAGMITLQPIVLRVQSRRHRTVLTLAGAMLLPAVPSNARAQTTVHATGMVGLTYTDNLLHAPSEPRPGDAPRISTFYLTLAPGLALYHNRERSRYLLTYSHPFFFYLNHSQLNNSGDIVHGEGWWALSLEDDLTLGVDATWMTSAAALNTAPAGGTTVQGDGRMRMFMLAVNEGWSHRFSDHWRGRQFSGFSRAETLSGPVPQPTLFAAVAGLGLDYVFERNALGFVSAATLSWTSDAPQVQMSRQQLIVDSFARYRRDLSASWSWEARLGVVTAFDLESHHYTAPRWGTSLFWQQDNLNGTLSYDRTVMRSLVTGFVARADTARISFGMPLGDGTQLVAVAGTGASLNRTLTSEQALGSTRTFVWTSDAAIRWTPLEELLNVSLTYLHTEQRNQGEYSTAVPSFAVNTVALLVTGRFPSRAFYSAPQASPQRVDGADRSSPADE